MSCVSNLGHCCSCFLKIPTTKCNLTTILQGWVFYSAVTQLCILIWTVLTTPLTTRTLSFWTESQGGLREELRRRYMLSANSHHSIKEGVCVTIWRGPTVQLLKRSLNVSRVRWPRPRVNNLIYRQSIRRSEDAPRKGCETSQLLENVSPVTRL